MWILSPVTGLHANGRVSRANAANEQLHRHRRAGCQEQPTNVYVVLVAARQHHQSQASPEPVPYVPSRMMPLWRRGLSNPRRERGTPKLVKSCIHIDGSLSPPSAVLRGPMRACLMVCPLARYATPSHSHAASQRLSSCFFSYIVSSGSEYQFTDGPMCEYTVHACGCRRRAVWKQMGVSGPAKLRPLRDVG